MSNRIAPPCKCVSIHGGSACPPGFILTLETGAGPKKKEWQLVLEFLNSRVSHESCPPSFNTGVANMSDNQSLLLDIEKYVAQEIVGDWIMGPHDEVQAVIKWCALHSRMGRDGEWGIMRVSSWGLVLAQHTIGVYGASLRVSIVETCLCSSSSVKLGGRRFIT